jgi:hypothetical protein
VTLDDSPLAGALVVFLGQGEADQAPVVAQTDNGGHFKLVGQRAGGIGVGKYKVMVSKMALRDGTVPAGEKRDQARQQGLMKNLLPRIYEEPATTPFQVDLHAGENQVDLPLKKRP